MRMGKALAVGTMEIERADDVAETTPDAPRTTAQQDVERRERTDEPVATHSPR